MNAAQLLAQYERIAEAPDAITRLRRFVLDLAVRGRLVPQDAGDEPAVVLLGRLRKAQAAALVRERLRSRPSVARVARDDLWFTIPDSWQCPSFDDLFVIVSGVTLGQRVTASDTVEVPYLRVANVQRGFLDLTVMKTLAMRSSDLDRYTLRYGDLLMTEGGDWDKLGRTAVWRQELTSCIHQNHVFRVRPPSDEISSEWVALYANSQLGQQYFANAAKQTTNLASINLTQLRGCPLPLPPLPEQRRIVAKVDELMALCDRLEAARTAREATRDRLVAASLARLNTPDPETFPSDARFALDALPALTTRPDQIKQLRQTILNLAVRGKLVPQDPNDEPADKLREQLGARFALDRAPAGRRSGRTDAAAGVIEEPVFPVPSGWVWARMGTLGDTNVGLTYSPADVDETGCPVLRSNNIQGGKIDLSGLVRVRGAIKSSVMVQIGDMLICARNGSRSLVGKAALVEKLPEPMAFGAFMAIFRSPVNPYLHLFVSSPVFRQVIDEVNTNTINQITQANLRSTLVPLPPLAEQHRIVAKVNELMVLCDALESSLTATSASRRGLLDALLTESFAPMNVVEMETLE